MRTMEQELADGGVHVKSSSETVKNTIVLKSVQYFFMLTKPLTGYILKMHSGEGLFISVCLTKGRG